jgi:hypothetical protein
MDEKVMATVLPHVIRRRIRLRNIVCGILWLELWHGSLDDMGCRLVDHSRLSPHWLNVACPSLSSLFSLKGCNTDLRFLNLFKDIIFVLNALGGIDPPEFAPQI